MNRIDDSELGSTIVEETLLDKSPKTDTQATPIPYASREHHEASPAITILDAIAPAHESNIVETSSTYNIFWRKDRRHFIITPFDCPERDRPWKKPRFKPEKGKDGELKEAPIDVFEADLPQDVVANSYFVHHPYISFHSPPRTFRRGGTKNSPTLALIKNSWFWRKWKLQFGEQLADDRIVDPRGVVSLPFDSGKTRVGEKAIKGYRVRKWRLWGETGKQYHHDINARRKENAEGRNSNADYVQERASHDTRPVIATNETIDEVVYFSWHSPFTHRTRDYHFQHWGIDFYWKGTGTVKEGRTCGACLHFNHLKLVAHLPPVSSNDDGYAIQEKNDKHIEPVRPTYGSKIWQRSSPTVREICFAKYTSSLGKKKAGTLVIYDEALYHLLKECVVPFDSNESTELGSEIVSVKHTRLYDIIVATAMCMVIGEWQKREWLRKIIELAAGEAGGNAGGS